MGDAINEVTPAYRRRELSAGRDRRSSRSAGHCASPAERTMAAAGSPASHDEPYDAERRGAGWDSNPHWTVFETASLCRWDTGATGAQPTGSACGRTAPGYPDPVTHPGASPRRDRGGRGADPHGPRRDARRGGVRRRGTGRRRRPGDRAGRGAPARPGHPRREDAGPRRHRRGRADRPRAGSRPWSS